MLALAKARQCGADLWETDVRLTSDGGVVLFHDHTLERTTDIASHMPFRTRHPWNLSDFSAAELRLLNAGSWFIHHDPFGTIASGEVTAAALTAINRQKIPHLREVLRYCRQHDFPVNLEIKDHTGTPADGKIVSAVLELIRASATEHLVLLSSFNHDYLRRIKHTNPTIATAALAEFHHPDNLIDYLNGLAVDAYHPNHQIADAALIKQLSAEGIRTNLWTVNDIVQARYVAEAGATFICSDWPQRLIGNLRCRVV